MKRGYVTSTQVADDLEHAIRAACNVSGDTELYIFGSQAILGKYPDAPAGLRASIEVDIQPKNKPEKTIDIDGALGELSSFHQTFGFYVHGLEIDAATLPEGWENRTAAVRSKHGTRGNTGYCLEAHELAASKLVANRNKDRIFVTTMLVEQLDIERNEIERICQWIDSTASEIHDFR